MVTKKREVYAMIGVGPRFPKRIRIILSFIAKKEVEGNWFFIGSVGTQLAGMKMIKHNDVDIAVDKKARIEFESIFQPTKIRKSKGALFFQFEGTKIELCPLERTFPFFKRVIKENHLHFIQLEDRVKMYYYLKNIEKARKIEKYLERNRNS